MGREKRKFGQLENRPGEEECSLRLDEKEEVKKGSYE